MRETIYTIIHQRGTRFEVLLFALLAILLFGMNTARIFWEGLAGEYLVIAFELVFSLSLFIAGRFPFAGGGLYILIYGVSSFVPLFSEPTTFLYLGMIPLLGLWISNSWYITTSIAFVVSHAHIVIAPASQLRNYLEYAILEIALAIIIGFVIRMNKKNVYSLHERLIGAQQQIENLEREIRMDLATELHDYIAKDLALISIMAQENQLSPHGLATNSDWTTVAALSQSASSRLRSLIVGMKEKVTADSVINIVNQNQRLLGKYHIRLVTSYTNSDIETLTPTQLRLLSLFFREGFMNIFKYATRYSKVDLAVHTDDAGAVFVLLANEIARDKPKSAALSSDFGLHNLARVFEKEHASIVADRVASSWVLSARIPGPQLRLEVKQVPDES